MFLLETDKMKIRCIKLFNGLTIGRIYHVLEVSYGPEFGLLFRFLGDHKIPALYDYKLFELVSNKIPEEWCVKFKTDSIFELTPKDWERDSFWEDYFNGEPEAVKIFLEVARKIVADEPVEDSLKPSFFPPWSPF